MSLRRSSFAVHRKLANCYTAYETRYILPPPTRVSRVCSYNVSAHVIHQVSVFTPCAEIDRVQNQG